MPLIPTPLQPRRTPRRHAAQRPAPQRLAARPVRPATPRRPRRLALLLASLLLPLCAAFAQSPTRLDSLFTQFKRAALFDRNYPREKVFLHLDNNAYFEGETLWFKAYVVRASSLRPAPLSRVLYVELLNAAGQTMNRLQLRIDSLGQANGQIDLKDYYKSGFYELRAYTREMLNWGDEACYSRVIPVVRRPVAESQPLTLAQISQEKIDINRPLDATDLPANAARPFAFGTKRQTRAEFYPEGGLRAAGIAQRVAFRLTDGRGAPLTDTLRLLNAQGYPAAAAVAEHEGMGLVQLPAEADETWCFEVRGRKFPLPAAAAEARAVLTALPADSGLVLRIDGGGQTLGLLGLAVHCREQMCYFDTLTLAGDVAIDYLLPAAALRPGVNRIELFAPSGRSLARRLVWGASPFPRLRLHVRQSREAYDAFAPVALELNLTDTLARPVAATFSLAVRDADAELAAPTAGNAEAALLLASEVKGYIRRPEQYFSTATADATRRQALDLLLMVQGWTANTFETLCSARPFSVKQPIEEQLTLTGRVYHQDDRRKPRPNFPLKLIMYSEKGEVLRAETLTDSTGRFAFASAVDFTGDDWLATFITRNEAGKKRWSRIAIDRWFAPRIRPYDFREMLIEPPYPTPELQAAATAVAPANLFAWRDTLRHTGDQMLGEAVVKSTKKRYRGFTGNRYTYGGGEKNGLRHAVVYYNFIREVERYKDAGYEPGYFSDFYNYLCNTPYDAQLTPDEISAADQTGETAATALTNAETAEGEHLADPTERRIELRHRGRAPERTYLNNDQGQAKMLGEMMADEVKSVMITEDDGGAIYVYEIPNYDRYRSKRGVERRRISGFAEARKFFSPDYRGNDLPSPADVRRTLYWNPSVTTDAAGRASAVFFNNSRPGTRLRISAEGVTPQGLISSAR